MSLFRRHEPKTCWISQSMCSRMKTRMVTGCLLETSLGGKYFFLLVKITYRITVPISLSWYQTNACNSVLFTGFVSVSLFSCLYLLVNLGICCFLHDWYCMRIVSNGTLHCFFQYLYCTIIYRICSLHLQDVCWILQEAQDHERVGCNRTWYDPFRFFFHCGTDLLQHWCQLICLILEFSSVELASWSSLQFILGLLSP